MPVVRALHTLTTNGNHQAATTLLTGDALFRLILADKTADEAKPVFNALATPADVSRFEQ